MPAWTTPFLAALSAAPNVSAACKSAGIARQTAYEAREKDPEFARLWDDALAVGVDDLAGECYRRARHGVARPVFYRDQVVGHVTEYSDTLAIFLLKSHRPEVYRETVRQEVSGGLEVGVAAALDAALAKAYGPRDGLENLIANQESGGTEPAESAAGV